MFSVSFPIFFPNYTILIYLILSFKTFFDSKNVWEMFDKTRVIQKFQKKNL